MSIACVQTPEVLAYYVGNERSGLPYQYLQSFYPWITYLAIVNYTVSEDGSLHGSTDPKFLEDVLNWGMRPLIVPQNFAKGTFSPAVIHHILNNAAAEKKMVDDLLCVLKQFHYHGWDLDFEAISPEDRTRFSQLTRQLKAWALPMPYLASVAVQPVTKGEPSGQNYRALAQTNNFLMIMTYDEHWSGGKPGPIASIPWMESVIQYALTQVPPDQILLGIPLYGFDWEVPMEKGKLAEMVSFRQAVALAKSHGAKAVWSPTAQEPYFSYMENGRQHVVWFQDPRSWASKISLVFKYHLRGIGVWDMEHADPEFWRTLEETLVHFNTDP